MTKREKPNGYESILLFGSISQARNQLKPTLLFPVNFLAVAPDDCVPLAVT